MCEVVPVAASTVASTLSRTVSSVPVLESGESSNIGESALLPEIPVPVKFKASVTPPLIRATIPFALMPKVGLPGLQGL